MPGIWITKAIALAAAICLTLAPAPRTAAQNAGGTAAPKLTQLIRVFDATLVYPPPLWITSQESLLKVRRTEIFADQDNRSAREFPGCHPVFES